MNDRLQARAGLRAGRAFLYPYLSGREYLQLAARSAACRNAAQEKIDALLELFSLYEHRYSADRLLFQGMSGRCYYPALLHNPADHFRRAALRPRRDYGARIPEFDRALAREAR